MTAPLTAVLPLLLGGMFSIPDAFQAGEMSLRPASGRHALAAQALEFAEFLIENRQAHLAVIEYQRCLWYAADDSTGLRATAANGVARAYAESGAYKEVLLWAEAPILRTLPACRLDTLHLHAARAALRLGSLDLARRHFTALEDSCPRDSATLDWQSFLLGVHAVHSGRWADAERLFLQVRPDAALGPTASQYAMLARHGEVLPHKNPTLAGWLGMLPGAGYFYGGFRGTGFSALVINVALAAAAREAFRSGHGTSGGLLTALTATWYVGGIYGSAQSARRYNAHYRDALTRRFEY